MQPVEEYKLQSTAEPYEPPNILASKAKSKRAGLSVESLNVALTILDYSLYNFLPQTMCKPQNLRKYTFLAWEHYLCFSLFQTLPDLGLPRGILLSFWPVFSTAVAAILFSSIIVRLHTVQRK